MSWKLILAKQAIKDLVKLDRSGRGKIARELLDVIAHNPFAPYPPYEKLSNNLEGLYSRRINVQHRIVYEVFAEEKTVRIIQMWTHYDKV
jgi:Txe/YoeB family toxin of toxin-antitoxin system